MVDTSIQKCSESQPVFNGVSIQSYDQVKSGAIERRLKFIASHLVYCLKPVVIIVGSVASVTTCTLRASEARAVPCWPPCRSCCGHCLPCSPSRLLAVLRLLFHFWFVRHSLGREDLRSHAAAQLLRFVKGTVRKLQMTCSTSLCTLRSGFSFPLGNNLSCHKIDSGLLH